MPAAVEIDEVQANVLYAYPSKLGRAMHIRVRLQDTDGARSLVARWLRRASFGISDRLPPGATPVTVAFGPRGLAVLGVPRDQLEAFPSDFREGAQKRAASLGDRWSRDPGDDDADALLSIYGGERTLCRNVASELLRGMPRDGVRILSCRHTWFKPGGAEAFGFADGRSQPAIEGVDTDPVGDGLYVDRATESGGLVRGLGATAESLGLKRKPRAWRTIRAGEFLLGYENEDGVRPAAPPAPLGPNGTFMVYREMDQHTGTFDAYVERAAAANRMDAEQLAAKIVGRWRNGTPVARVPDEDDIAQNRRRANDFRYASDPDGIGCPLGAHARRANPRDGLPGGGERTMRHRIIRRGMSYGRRGYGQGLAFLCFGASIARGFEFIQREWINGGHALGIDEPDFLLQQPADDGELPGRMVVPGYRTTVLQPPSAPFVTVRGCDYLFLPSRRACAWLAAIAEAR